MFFFLRLRQPPRSTLFPTRRSSDLTPSPSQVGHGLVMISRTPSVTFWRVISTRPSGEISTTKVFVRSSSSRSEEHTSELQSRQYLVCRLLLEKKKHTTTSLRSSSTK